MKSPEFNHRVVNPLPKIQAPSVDISREHGFKTAYDIFKSVSILNDEGGSYNVQGIMVAFAAEVLLKSILRANGNVNPWGHNLLALYQAIPKTQQKKAEAYFREFKIDDFDIVDVFGSHQNDFEKLRYVFEAPSFNLIWPRRVEISCRCVYDALASENQAFNNQARCRHSTYLKD